METAAADMARRFDAAVPLGRANGSTPLMPLSALSSLADSAGATSALISNVSRGWAVLPAADMTGWVSISEPDIVRAVAALESSARIQWGLAPPTEVKVVCDPDGRGGLVVSWRRAEQAAGAPPLAHWLVRWHPEHAQDLLQGVMSFSPLANLGTQKAGAALLPADRSQLSISVTTARALFAARRNRVLAISAASIDPAAAAPASLLAPAPFRAVAAGEVTVTPIKRGPAVKVLRSLGSLTPTSSMRPTSFATVFRVQSSRLVWLRGLGFSMLKGRNAGVMKIFCGAAVPTARANAVVDADIGSGGEAPLTAELVWWDDEKGACGLIYSLDFSAPVRLQPDTHYTAFVYMTSPAGELVQVSNWSDSCAAKEADGVKWEIKASLPDIFSGFPAGFQSSVLDA